MQAAGYAVMQVAENEDNNKDELDLITVVSRASRQLGLRASI